MKFKLGYAWFCARMWWHESIDSLRWRIAWLIPRSIALLCFVRVYAASKQVPGPEYCNAYRAFEREGLAREQ